MKKTKLKPEIKAYIEAELRDYHETLRELQELKEDIAVGAPVIDDVGGNTGRADPLNLDN